MTLPPQRPADPSLVRPFVRTFFHTTTRASAAAFPSSAASYIDAAVIPDMADDAAIPEAAPNVPLLPDADFASHGLSKVTAAEEPPPNPDEATIVAADPENVLPGTPMRRVDPPSLDSIELKFVHEHQDADAQTKDDSTMLGDLWRGMLDDVFGAKGKAA